MVEKKADERVVSTAGETVATTVWLLVVLKVNLLDMKSVGRLVASKA